MKENKYNSSRRTHEKIREAFSELLREKKSIDKITVTELASRAEVTRGTFYAHFQNMFEVAEDLEKEFVSELNNSMNNFSGPIDIDKCLQQIFSFLSEHEELYRNLLSSDAAMSFISRLNIQIRNTIKQILLKSEYENPDLELDATFFTDGATYMILKYFRNETSLSLDEIKWYLKQRFSEMFLQNS